MERDIEPYCINGRGFRKNHAHKQFEGIMSLYLIEITSEEKCKVLNLSTNGDVHVAAIYYLS